MSPTRPPGVPEDWIEVPCDNGDCPNMAWVPNPQVPSGTQSIRVCSTPCAMVLVEALGARLLPPGT